MKKLLFTLGAGFLLSAAAYAGPVTYSTVTSQLCVGASGCGVLTQTVGDVRITFNPIATSTVTANPTTFGSFGEVVIACVGGGSGCGSQSLAGLNLFINIGQTVPNVGSGTIPGSISGSISGTASQATIAWTNGGTVNIAPITYTVLNNPLGLVPVTTNAGVTSIQAVITDGQVPEPSTYMLISGSLVGLGLLRKRLKK